MALIKGNKINNAMLHIFPLDDFGKNMSVVGVILNGVCRKTDGMKNPFNRNDRFFTPTKNVGVQNDSVPCSSIRDMRKRVWLKLAMTKECLN
jgi:hypothetical protein